MTKMKKTITTLIVSLSILGVAGTAYAAELKTPADIVAGLTGKAVTEVTAERATGKTYGTIANDAGQLEAFKAEMILQKKAILDERVANGTLTQERATQIYDAIQANQATCDGTNPAQIGRANGVGFGQGMMQGQGQMQGRGQGMGQGMRNGGMGMNSAFNR
ncbi:MAG: hypothetical protein AB7E31_04680 [Desulfitobacterium sp.]